jgi:rubrerythrin
MHKPTDTGTNRTGIQTSPIDQRRTVHGANVGIPPGQIDGQLLRDERTTWARAAEPLGTVPPAASVKGVIKTLLEKLRGHQPTVFIDKLGERLAFERTGVRIYEAVIAKISAADPHPAGPNRRDLEDIRRDELDHFALVRDAIEQLGADPTAVTPSADLVAVSSLGWIQAVTDPRTTLTQCLDVLMMAELADRGGWEVLIALADQLDFEEMSQKFRNALRDEDQHVAQVRAWIMTAVRGEADGDAVH